MFRGIDLSDKKKKKNAYISVLKDFGISLIILAAATIAGYLFKLGGLTDSNIIMLYIIAVLVISILTSKIYYCLGSSIVGVLVFNYLFTYPEFSFSAHDAGYPVTFLTMFITALIAGTLANKLKRNTLIAEQNAREKEEAALLAQNEQLRANMLRTISHDLRPYRETQVHLFPAELHLTKQQDSRSIRISFPSLCG